MPATLAVVVAACAPISPPPLFERHAGAGRESPGTLTVTLAVGVGLASISGGLGFSLRARYQAFDDVAVGGDVGYAWGDGDPNETVTTTRILGLRAFTVANPGGQDAVALTFGAGTTLMNTGLRALSLDAGAVTSGTIGDTVEPSLGLAAAMVVPVVQGEPFGARGDPTLPTTTFYYGGNVGLGIHFPSTKNVFSLESGLLLARSISGESATALYLSGADAQSGHP